MWARRLSLFAMISLFCFLQKEGRTQEFRYGEIMGSYKEVPAYCNGKSGNGEGKWQCVEYVRRFYKTVYQVDIGPVGNNEIGHEAWHGFNDTWGKKEYLERHPNGSEIPPEPDDILCYQGGAAGHVAIVVEVGSDHIKVIEQNFSQKNCYREIALTDNNSYYLAPSGKYEIQGWLHYADQEKVRYHQSPKEPRAGEDYFCCPIQSSKAPEDFLLGLGHRIAFLSNRRGSQGFYFADLDPDQPSGKCRVQKISYLKDVPEMQPQFSVSPDNRYVLFLDWRNHIFVLVLDPTALIAKDFVDLKIEAFPIVFPSWIENDTFLYMNSRARFKKARIVEKLRRLGDKLPGGIKLDLGKITDLIKSVGIKTEKLEYHAEIEDFSTEQDYLSSRKDSSNHSQLAIMHNGNLAPRKWLTHDNLDNTEPSFGKSATFSMIGASLPIVFVRGEKALGRIWRADFNQGLKNLRLVSPPTQNDHSPCFGLFTRKIFFTTGKRGERRIGIMSSDGSHREILNLR